MPINLERWEINLILNALAKLPYEEVAATIQRIKEQVEVMPKGGFGWGAYFTGNSTVAVTYNQTECPW